MLCENCKEKNIQILDYVRNTLVCEECYEPTEEMIRHKKEAK